jgi:hypothetical protein
MPPYLKLHPFLLTGIFTTFLTQAALPTRAAGGCSTADFAVARSFDIGTNSGFSRVSLSVADFNGDGKTDVAATDLEGNAVAVFLNDGTGWFASPTKLAVGLSPSAVTIADFNGDGRPDLAVANSGSNNVSVLLGSDGGNFGAATAFGAGTGPGSLAVGDFNGDGKIDIAVGNIQGRSVSMLLGDGTGAFSTAPGSPFALVGQVLAVNSADFNSDTKRDLVVGTNGATQDENGFFVLTGNGAGGFSSQSRVFTNGGLAAAAGDLSGDGDADLVLGHFGGMAVLIGDGAGNFSAPTLFTLETGGSVDSIAIGDLDADNKPDIAASSTSSGITLFRGDGVGGFSRGRTYLVKSSPFSVALSDFDSDGKQDTAAGGPSGQLTSFSIMLNTGAGVFAAPRAVGTNASSFGSSATDVAVDDFNGDGLPDMAVSHSGQAGVNAIIAILLNDANGGFTPMPPISFFPGSSFRRVVTADFNEDGKADVAVAGTISIPFQHVVSVSFGNGNGTFGTPLNISGFFGQNPYDFAVGEFNNDGNLDIVVVSGTSQNYSILFGNGSGGFAFAAVQSVGTRFDRVAVGDFTGDSKQDLVITDFDDARVVVLRNNDGGLFGVIQSIDLPGRPSAVVVDDFNSDGKRDIAVASQILGGNSSLEEGRISVLLGDGAGGFAAAVHHEISSMAEDLLSRDLDGDGHADLAVVDRTASTVSVLSGDGVGAFSPSLSFDVAGGPWAIAAQDFNSDSRADLALLPPFGRTVVLLFGKAATSEPCLFADDVAITEPSSQSTDAGITVRLSAPSAQLVKVNYLLHSFSATAGQDFTNGAGMLVFQPGETSKVVTVPILGDIIEEPAESFALILSASQNARISDGIGKVTISDNDPPPTISISDVSVAEGNANFTSATFNLSLSAPSAFTVSVDFAVVSGTATVSTDFDAGQGSLVFGPGTTSGPVTVSVRGDITHEPDETFFVNLSNPVNSTIADGQGQGTILNDDPVPAITALNASGFEMTGADTTLLVTVNLSNPSSVAVSVDFSTADDTALAGSDYNASTGSLTFNPGETLKTIGITVRDDLLDEPHETFFVNLSNAVQGTIADGQSLCQIFDNDGPAISINDINVVEGESGRTTANFTISLSAASPQSVGVRISTANGTASGTSFPADFVAISNRFIFIPAGSTTATVSVFVNGDVMIEPDETFFVNLSQPQEGTIADAQGVGTITNDDVTSVQFSNSAASVNEADGKVQVTVMRVGDLSGVFTAAYSTFDSSASERSDYTASLGSLRFEPNETSKTITVFITNDALLENTENFFIALSGQNGGPTNQPSVADITINSDDAVPGPNPVDASTFFVNQHYRDFLNRDPDAAGLQFWVGQIEECGTDAQCREVRRINVSAAFFLSIEFQETGYLTYRFYKAAFGDATSPNVPGTVPIIRLRDFLFDAQSMGQGVQVGIGDWQQRLEANKQAYALEFVQRSRFLGEFPLTITADQFVTKLEQHVGAALSPEERAALIAVLGSTPADSANRAQVVRAVAEDADLRQAELNRAFVLMQYYGYLRRNPNDPQDTDFRGWKFWLDKLNQFNGNFIEAEMVKAFISSIEYRQRFGQ